MAHLWLKEPVYALQAWDILPEANATKVGMNPNTRYYTIAGDWAKEVGGNPTIPGPDDGLVQSLVRNQKAIFKVLAEQNMLIWSYWEKRNTILLETYY